MDRARVEFVDRKKSMGEVVKKTIVGNEYFELVRRFALRPIRSEKELDGAIAVIDDLIARETRSSEADDYLDVLSDLVEKYESEHHPIPDASPVEILGSLIEDRQTNQRAVAHGTGIATSTMSQMLAGHRQMNLDHMRKLSAFFGVDLAVFLPAESKVARQAAPARKRVAAPRRRSVATR
jgi:HTH-type transcriptional regulator/antitoxin HigA